MAEGHLTFAPLPFDSRFKNRTGMRYGAMTVLGLAREEKYGRQRRRSVYYWHCRCDCGAIHTMATHRLLDRRRGIPSCGCVGYAAATAKRTRHGHAKRAGISPEYRIWTAMNNRCHSPHGHYKGSGITVCERWRTSYEAFLSDMGFRPSPSHGIERIDNSHGYKPGNCRWATRHEQSRNKRTNRLITFRGETLCLTDWANRIGVAPPTLKARLGALGWPLEKALTRPSARQSP